MGTTVTFIDILMYHCLLHCLYVRVSHCGRPPVRLAAQQPARLVQVRSGQVRFITRRPKSRTMRAKRKKRSRANTQPNRTKAPAQMSNELESDRAMVMNLESFGVDGAGYDETESEPPSSTNPQ